MDTGGDRGERPDNDGGGSGFSRRHFLAGSVMAIGGSSALISGTTSAQFSDSDSASGSVGVATINRAITDNTDANDPHYLIEYEVVIDKGFESIDITVDKLDSGGGQQTYNRTTKQGAITYDYSWGTNFEFTFDVNVGSTSDPVLSESVPDTADGTDPSGNNDLSDPNSPAIDWIVVDDSSHEWGAGAVYDLYYGVANPSNFGEMTVEFRNTNNTDATSTVPSSDSPIGSVHYEPGSAYGDPYEIIARVKNLNDVNVNQTTIQDAADGDDPSGVGSPVLTDSPLIDTFTVQDNTNGDVEFVVDYTLKSASRLDRVDVIFADLDQGEPPDRMTGPAQQNGSVTYTADDWRSGHEFQIQVEPWEQRDGVAFPVDSGIVTDVAGGSDSQTTYP